jgi:hypothetical protein
MSITPGFTSAEIVELVMHYQSVPHGQKTEWLAKSGVSSRTFRRWRVSVLAGDVHRGLIPRDGSQMTIPPDEPTPLEIMRAADRAAHDAEVTKLNSRVRELEETNTALGKAIGLLHAMSEEEPARPPTTPESPSS